MSSFRVVSEKDFFSTCTDPIKSCYLFPKESALALTVWVPLVRVALISLVYWFLILPYINILVVCIFYSPKESALAPTVWVFLVRVALISLVYWFWIFTTLRTGTFFWGGGGRWGVFLGKVLIFFKVVWMLFSNCLAILCGL